MENWAQGHPSSQPTFGPKLKPVTQRSDLQIPCLDNATWVHLKTCQNPLQDAPPSKGLLPTCSWPFGLLPRQTLLLATHICRGSVLRNGLSKALQMRSAAHSGTVLPPSSVFPAHTLPLTLTSKQKSGSKKKKIQFP